MRLTAYVFFFVAFVCACVSIGYADGHGYNDGALAIGWLCFSVLLTYFGWTLLVILWSQDDDDDDDDWSDVVVPDAPPSEWVKK